MALALSLLVSLLSSASAADAPAGAAAAGPDGGDANAAPAVPPPLATAPSAAAPSDALASGPLDPGAGRGSDKDDCWLAPNEMSLTEYVYDNGGFVERGGHPYCLRRLNADMLRFRPQARVVGSTRFGRLQLFGQPLAYGVDIVLKPGDGVSPDFVYTVPVVDLPEPWATTLEKVATPIVVVGSAALITTVLVELFGK